MSWHPKKTLVALGAVAGLCLTGCGRPAMGPPAMVPEVAVVTIQPQRIMLTADLPGRTSAYRIAEIRPQVSGLIQKRLFVEGSLVKAGEVLYEIDPAPYQAAYDSALANLTSAKEAAARAQASLNASIAALERHEAVLELAKTNFRRHAELLKDKAVSVMEYDQASADVKVANAGLRVAQVQVEGDRQAVEVAKAAIKQAEAALESANINLRYTKITSPIAGRIGRSSVTEGAIATAYQATALATVQQLDPIYVDVTQSTVQLQRLKRSLANGSLTATGTDKVKIILEDGTPYSQPGSLQFYDVTVDQTTGSVVLRIVVPNADGTLLPGMFVRAVIEEGVREDAMLVPQQAVFRDPKGNPMTMIVDGEQKVQTRALTTDRSIGDKWLVSTGLVKGDRVIVEGIQRARPGMTVRVAQSTSDGDLAARPADRTPTRTP